MKRILQLALLLILLCSSRALADGSKQYAFSSATPSPSVYLIGSSITYHKLVWMVTGTVNTCSIEVDSSSDGVSWNTADVIPVQDCTSNGAATIAYSVSNYIRINPTVFTGTGSVTAVWSGYNNLPATVHEPTWVWFSPSTADSGKLQAHYSLTSVITRVFCKTDGLGSMNINLEIRPEGTGNHSGTTVLASPLACSGEPGGATTTISNAIIPATSTSGYLLTVMVTGSSGTPGVGLVAVATQ